MFIHFSPTCKYINVTNYNTPNRTKWALPYEYESNLYQYPNQCLWDWPSNPIFAIVQWMEVIINLPRPWELVATCFYACITILIHLSRFSKYEHNKVIKTFLWNSPHKWQLMCGNNNVYTNKYIKQIIY